MRLGASVEDLRAISVDVPAAMKTLTVRFGLAAGPWTTAVERNQHDPASRIYVSPSGRGVVFTEPIENADKTVVVQVVYGKVDCENRIVAVDDKGQELTASSGGETFIGDISRLTAVFSNLPLKGIKQFRFQTRPYQWFEFRNVSLQPRRKADVQVLQPATPPAAAKAERLAPANNTPEQPAK